MAVKFIQVRNKDTGDLAEINPAALGHFPDFEPVAAEKPAETQAPATEQTAAKKPRSAADTNKEQ